MNSSDPYRTPAASALEPAGLRSGLTGYLDGTQPLWKAFWLVYLLGSVLVFGLLGIGISSVLVRGVLFLKHSLGLAQETAIVLLLAPPIIGFLAFSLLAIWRCADNTKLQLWTWLAQLFVILHGLWAASKLLWILL
ncbi:hypothetical protein [Pseudomonas sp. AN-1]|uniref:hypothetical protein n=1 Tax=Pseudomonas sp. AN-1 TaxID=3096605 RepID=UPI002A6A04CE|nr:hypothetical protein [Pseudomonas sp. AN-1]WPP44427.1 hypothetical protein SK095_14270 [Pseudomonas sp. AN-1]